MNILSGMSKKEKLGLAVAIGIVVLALFDRIIISPIASGFKKIDSETKTNERELALTMRNLTQKDAIDKEYNKYLQYIKSDYSEGEEVNKLLEEIEGIARGSDISIGDIKPQPPKQADFYRYYLIEIQAEARMENLLSFLYKLSSSKELFRASKVYISLKDKATSTVKASILVSKAVVQ